MKIDDKYGFVNKKGEEVIPPRYDYISSFRDGIIEVELDNKHGFVNKEG